MLTACLTCGAAGGVTKALFTSRHYVLVIADVEAFAKAMESETKSEQEGDSKDKKDDDEDMSLD